MFWIDLLVKMGVISTALSPEGNIEDFIVWFIFLHKKSAYKSEFSLVLLVEISEFWQDFLYLPY